jgi:hypothetical protein
MTYDPNDPSYLDPPVYDRAPVRDNYSATSWIVGALAVVAALGIIVWAISGNERTVATNERPAVTAPNTGTALRAPATRNPDTNVGTAPTPPAQR